MMNSERFDFVDLLRGIAMTVMIEVHIFNALLQPEIRMTSWFPLLNFINGLVAPAFIFVAGFAFVLSLQGKVNAVSFPFIRKRFSRILFIILLGYWIHLPALTLSGLKFVAKHRGLAELYNVDVLQCIGAGLLILLFLSLIIRSVILKKYNFAFLTLLFVLPCPFLWKIDFSQYLPDFCAAYFNELSGSYFPLFPWLGFLFAGSVISLLYLQSRESGRDGQFLEKIFFAGVVFALSGAMGIYFREGSQGFNIRSSPFFFIERLGVVMILLYVCRRICNMTWRFRGAILKVSRESLAVYWLHLLLLYKPFFSGRSLNDIFSGQLSFPSAALAAVLVIVLMYVFAWLWFELKKGYPLVFKRSFRLVLTFLTLLFLLK